VRKLEKNSSKQNKTRSLYENSDSSIREIAEKIKVDEKTVRNWAKAGSWVRKSADVPQFSRISEVAESVVEQLETATRDPDGLLPSEIARKTCGTLDALRAHLDTVVQNLHLVREMADAETAGDESPARARLVDKVLSLPGLVKAANDLTSAIARLADMGPGKKEEAKERAIAAGTGRFATPAAPKLGATTH
jgi:predicted DNA-binding protein YlxM (UPF0122 family)